MFLLEKKPAEKQLSGRQPEAKEKQQQGESKQETKEQKLQAQLRENGKAQQETKEQKLQAQLLELTETLKRVQADFENTCKRTEKEKAEFRQFANAAIVKELLPLLDSMDAAVEKMQKQENVKKEDVLDGLRLLRMQLLQLLQKHGLKEIKCLGEKFNPMLHEAMLQGCDESRQNECILEELQRGYLLNERVLRHSKVKINKKKEEGNAEIADKKEEKKNG